MNPGIGELIIFNDVTDVPVSSFALTWSGRWVQKLKPRGPVVVSGSVPDIQIEA